MSQPYAKRPAHEAGSSPARLDEGITLCGSLSQVPVMLGATMHNAGYRALDLAFTYVPFGVHDLPGALAGMRALGIRGFGVSVPFKQQIMPLLDELDPLAERIGAVNTVLNDRGRLIGYNTDWYGAVRALEEIRPIDGVRVLLIGAGGAARAIGYGLVEKGAELSLTNRTAAKGQQLADQLAAHWVAWDKGNKGHYDVVLNASSCGMAGNATQQHDSPLPLPKPGLTGDMIVMDIVYKPLDTTLLQRARQRGTRTIHGGRMLLYQAVRQFELYTDRDAPIAEMDKALRRAMIEQENETR